MQVVLVEVNAVEGLVLVLKKRVSKRLSKLTLLKSTPENTRPWKSERTLPWESMAPVGWGGGGVSLEELV